MNEQPDSKAVKPPEDGPSRGADAAEIRGEHPPEDEGKKRKRRSGWWWKRAAAVSLLIAAAFLAGRFGCGGGDGWSPGGGKGTPAVSPTGTATAEPAVFELVISGGDVFAAGRRTPPDEAARMAAESGLPVKLVYEPDARTGAEDALLRALERAGVKISETVRKD